MPGSYGLEDLPRELLRELVARAGGHLVFILPSRPYFFTGYR